MKSKQKALIVRCCPDSMHGLDELNVQLNRGWRVHHVAPMGAAGVGARDGSPSLHFAALVILEREREDEAGLLEEAEEEVEEVLDELTEGDGSTVELDDDFGPEPGRERSK